MFNARRNDRSVALLAARVDGVALTEQLNRNRTTRRRNGRPRDEAARGACARPARA